MQSAGKCSSLISLREAETSSRSIAAFANGDRMLVKVYNNKSKYTLCESPRASSFASDKELRYSKYYTMA